MSEYRRTVSLPRALALIKREVPRVGIESTTLISGLGRIIRQDLTSKRDYPAADIAERDGFCLAASTGARASKGRPALVFIEGSLSAGDSPSASIGRGRCLRIMTGALLPKGADTVIPVEEATARDGQLVVTRRIKRGSYVRRAGSEIRACRRVARTGDLLNPGLTGLLAASGIMRVKLARRVRVGIISTGDEIVDAASRAKPWQAPNSNAMMLSGQVQELGAEAVSLGICRDRQEDIIRCLRSARQCDVIVLTGGSSVGGRDLVPRALETYGCGTLLKGIRLRPGNHVLFARKGRQAFFGLPGRPAGCFTLFHLLVRPGVLAMMGSARPGPVRCQGVWEGRPMGKPAVDTVLAATMTGRSGVRPVSDKRGEDLDGLARADGLALLRAGSGLVRKGDVVDVFPIRFGLA